MDYKNLIITIILFALFMILIFSIGLLFLKLGFHLILESKVHNNEVEIKISIICFFNLIHINKIVYPIPKTNSIKNNNKKKYKENNKEDTKKQLDLKKIEIQDLKILFKILKKIKIVELYSNLEYGFEVIEVTSFIYFLINIIYGNIFNYFDSDKIYLNIKPCYTSTYINYTCRLHIKPTIKDIIKLLVSIIKIYMKTKKYSNVKNNKEEDVDEVSKFYKKFNGYNSGVN